MAWTYRGGDIRHMPSGSWSKGCWERIRDLASGRINAVRVQRDYEVRSMFLFGKNGLVGGLEQAEGVGGEMITVEGMSENSMVSRNGTTSSPSPMQLPSNVQADQFHLKPAREISALSMASSRLDKRERKRAFLFKCKRGNHWSDEGTARKQPTKRGAKGLRRLWRLLIGRLKTC